MIMRSWMVITAVLAGCAPAARPEEPEDPAALSALLGDGDARRREEAVQRMARAGLSVPPTEDTEGVGSEVLRALREDSPERMVWRAWHAIRLGCLAREWARVSEALARQGFRKSEMYEPDSGARFVRFSAKEGAYVDGAGGKHDLFFWVQARSRGGAWIVREVYVGLHASFDTPFRMAVAPGRYPRGSVLAQFLEMPEVVRLATVFPVLEEVELTYGRIRVKESQTFAAGFHVNAGFALAADGKGGGRGIAVTAESGLDPRETPAGRLVWDGFSPSESLGPLVVRGGSFWGAGGLRPSDE
jgi:hypothetical protein